jgi:hypothetical protein
MTITDTPAPEHAGRFRDIHRIYDLVETTRGLPMPFTGPDRAAFYFHAIAHAEDARSAVAAAKAVFAAELGAVFAWKDVWASNGTRRQYDALLPSGLEIVLTARAEHMQDEDEDAEAGELVAAA